MKLSFYGADQCVTGSCHCLEVGGRRILVDCGLQQGRDEVSNEALPFAANTIDFLLVTHAHIDHTGRIPMLIKEGFRGRILTTRLTADLMDIMLQDSAHIQEQDAEWKNRKAERSGAPRTEPLYTIEDAQRVRQYMTTCEYRQVIDLCEGVRAEFVDAGHLLGSASIIVTATEGGVTKQIVFSGDIGNVDQPIIRDPTYLTGADYVVMESTYGDRNHTEVWSYTDDLAKIIDETIAKGGNVVIPSFAVGRTQELLYFIREIKDAGMVKSDPDFPVYIDSPLAKKATTIFTGDLRGYLDEEALELVQDGTHMFNFTNLRMTETSEESKALNVDPTPKVIISASGMCDAGRIRHHLKHNLWRPECTVVFVGYQGEGTLGRSPAGGHQEREALRRGDRRPRADRELPGPLLPRGPGPPARVDPVHPGPQAPARVRGPRGPGGGALLRQDGPEPGLHRPRPPVHGGVRPDRRQGAGARLPARSGRPGPPAASGPAPPTSGWWPWATCSWRASSAPGGGTTSPWPGSPTSCGSCWRSGRANGALPPGRRRPGTWPPAPCCGVPPRRPRISSRCPSRRWEADPGAAGTGGRSAG